MRHKKKILALVEKLVGVLLNPQDFQRSETAAEIKAIRAQIEACLK